MSRGLRHIGEETRLAGLLWLTVLMGLMGCSKDQEQADRQFISFEAQPLMQSFYEELPAKAGRLSGITRAWTPPTGYYLYDATDGEGKPILYPIAEEQVSLINKSIDIFMTQDGTTPLHGAFYYKASNSTWHFDAEIEHSGDYYLYGAIPKEVVESSSISSSSTENDNSGYSNGAVLKLNGLRTVTHSDLCVIVGAKEGSNAETVTDLTTGQFKVNVSSATKNVTSGTNHVFLLFDHLYSALRFNFKVDATYDELRTIKLTKLELMAFESVGSNKLKAKYNATITLQKTTAGASPIQNIVFTPDNSSADVGYEPIYDGAEVTLNPITATSLMGCIVPGNNTHFMLRSTYNVYDKSGNLVREGCEAENDIDLRSLFNMTAVNLQRGHMYSLTLTVQPTYIYVLSEPDLKTEITIE